MTLRKKIIICGFIILFVPLVLALLLFFGVLHINNPSAKEYPIRGVDVSSYQGEVDWTFWQYSNRHHLKGYNGSERFIDMNVFIGSADEFFK